MDPEIEAKLLYLLGVVNVLSLMGVFLTCRCLTGPRLADWLVKRPWYKRFYQSHCWWWYILFVSVLLHTVLAFTTFGSPF